MQNWQQTKKSCSQCLASCQACAATLQKEIQSGKGSAQANHHYQLLQECADMCEISQSFLTHQSDFSKEALKLCSLMCESAFTVCSHYKQPEFQNCAVDCKKCIQECNKFILNFRRTA